MIIVRRSIATAAFVLAISSTGAFASVQSASAVRGATTQQVAVVAHKAPVVEASLMGHLMAIIHHFTSGDDTIHRG